MNELVAWQKFKLSEVQNVHLPTTTTTTTWDIYPFVVLVGEYWTSVYCRAGPVGATSRSAGMAGLAAGVLMMVRRPYWAWAGLPGATSLPPDILQTWYVWMCYIPTYLLTYWTFVICQYYLVTYLFIACLLYYNNALFLTYLLDAPVMPIMPSNLLTYCIGYMAIQPCHLLTYCTLVIWQYYLLLTYLLLVGYMTIQPCDLLTYCTCVIWLVSYLLIERLLYAFLLIYLLNVCFMAILPFTYLLIGRFCNAYNALKPMGRR